MPSIVEADTRQRIQETLDQHVTALARRDLSVYQRTLDPCGVLDLARS